MLATIGRAFAAALIIAAAAILGVKGWRACGKYGELCEQNGQFFPVRNPDTGHIDVVMHDVNGNGVVDTWVYRSETGVTEIEIDKDEDGKIDGVLSPDPQGVLRLADVRVRKIVKEQ